MLAISNFGIAFKKAQIGYLKEKIPQRGSSKPLLV